MDERGFFDKLAPTWDENEMLSTPEKVNHILDFMDIRKGQSVLDLGTGTGVLIPYIAERVGEKGKITAVDYSQEMLKRAKQKFEALVPTPEFLNMDFETENLDEEYDRIILYCVYPHLHTPVETLKWLKSVNLKEAGLISIAFPCSEEFINNIHKEKLSESDRLLPAEELALFFRDNGLEAEVASASTENYIVNIKK